MIEKPKKKSELELNGLISEKIIQNEYVFLKHAKQRLKDRAILDYDVLDILEGIPERKRKRNPSKDRYEEGNADWNYCIEGINLDGDRIRIIVSFDENLLLIITVIRLD